MRLARALLYLPPLFLLGCVLAVVGAVVGIAFAVAAVITLVKELK